VKPKSRDDLEGNSF